MNKNIIWLGIGAIGVYLLLSRKKASATNVEPTKEPIDSKKDIPTPIDGENKGINPYENMPIGISKELMDAILDLGKISDSSLKMQYENLECNPIRTAIKLTSEQVRKNELKKRALIYVADQRGIKLNCKKYSPRFANPLPKERVGDNVPYGAPPIENIKRLATGIN